MKANDRKSIKSRNKAGFLKAAIFLAAILVTIPVNSATGATGTGTPSESGREAAIEEDKAKAVEESLLKAQTGTAQTVPDTTKKEPVPAIIKQAPPAAPGEAAVEETAPKAAEVFFTAEDIRWMVRADSATLEITGEEKELPPAVIETDQGGRTVRWTPGKTLVVKKKKNNPVESPFLKGVIFRENVEKTKKLGLEAPYYAVDEIVLVFADPVFYDAMQEEGRITIEFSPVEKKKQAPPDIEAAIRKMQEVMSAKTSSPADILGSFFQAQEQFENYIVGGFSPEDVVRRMRAEYRPSQQLFDGTRGFPANMKPVYEQEYPRIGTAEYWKKHVRAALKNTFGYSTDFDGTPSAWSGTSTRDKAWLLTPDVEMAYDGFGFEKPAYGRRTPDASLNLSYRARRLFPVAHLLRFGDGLRQQTINFGGNYLPQKRYALFAQNSIVLFGGKTVDRSGGDFVRDPRTGYRMTNAAGFNYRLTQKLLWKNGIGYELTWSKAPAGLSRDRSGFLTTALEQVFTRRSSAELNYTYRHIYRDTGPTPSPSVRITKGKDLHHLSGVFRYKLSRTDLAEGGPALDVIDGNIFKFGVRAKLRYQWGPKDRIQADYFNGAIQEDTNKLVGVRGNTGGSTKMTLSRYEKVGVSYWHAIDGFIKATRPKTQLALSFDYRRNLPMSGVYFNQLTDDSGFNLQASLIRKLRGGLMWLELTYRYSTFRSRDPNMNRLDSTDISVKEHAILLILTNYFGQWGEMT